MKTLKWLYWYIRAHTFYRKVRRWCENNCVIDRAVESRWAYGKYVANMHVFEETQIPLPDDYYKPEWKCLFRQEPLEAPHDMD